jgi:hypothetical protein
VCFTRAALEENSSDIEAAFRLRRMRNLFVYRLLKANQNHFSVLSATFDNKKPSDGPLDINARVSVFGRKSPARHIREPSSHRTSLIVLSTKAAMLASSRVRELISRTEEQTVKNSNFTG